MAEHKQCCLWKVSFFPWISYSLLLEVTTVCNLWQKASSIFGSGSLNFLEVFSSQTAIIFQTCFMLSLSDASSLSFSEQNVVFSRDWVVGFFKLGIESHMVMIWECQAWFFFFLKQYLSLWAVNSLQKHQRECVLLDQGDFFSSTTSLPAVVFMIRGRRSRHLWVLAKRQIFNGIHPSWVTLNRQPGGVGGIEQQRRGPLLLSALASQAYNKLS